MTLNKVLLLCLALTFFEPVNAYCPINRKYLPRRKLDDENPTYMEGQIPDAQDLSNPLVKTNENFHANYDQAKVDMIPQTKLIVEGDYIVLHLQNGSRFVEQVNTMYYHNLKMVSHLPLNAYIILIANVSASVELSPETLDSLSVLQGLIQNVSLREDMFLTEEQYLRQVNIWTETIDFLSSILDSKSCSYDRLADFAWSMSADAAAANLDDAAEIQVNNTHAVVMRWKEELIPPSEWETLYTINTAG